MVVTEAAVAPAAHVARSISGAARSTTLIGRGDDRRPGPVGAAARRAGRRGRRWTAVEAALGLRLPADFKALVGHYGIGQFDDITLWTPFDTHTDGVFALVEHARRLLDDHRPLRDEFPEDFPYPLYPEPGGLLEWTGTGNGDWLCWLTGGEPDSWPVVVWNIRNGAYRYEVGAVELLYGYLSGHREVELLRPAPAVPWFDPYRVRSHVYVKLSEGNLPYVERLRILREVLAPTADRGGYDGGKRRAAGPLRGGRPRMAADL